MNKRLMLHDLQPLIIVSPHFDDAVFGCGELLAALPGTVVATVFTGAPDERLCTEWDSHCGFADASDAMRARRDEDRAALGLLGAQPEWLGFCDAQYGCSPSVKALINALDKVVIAQRARAVMMPLGLFHSDHLLAHAACVALQARRPRLIWLAYADALYRHFDGLLQERLASLCTASICATPVHFGASAAECARQQALKRRAIAAYASQLRAFGGKGYDDILAPESYWRLQWRPSPKRCGHSRQHADSS